MKIKLTSTLPASGVPPTHKGERSSVADGVFSPSAVETFLECPRKFYHQYIVPKEGARESSISVNFGTAMHAGVAAFYRTRGDKVAALQAFAESWKSFNMAGDAKKNLSTGAMALMKYMEFRESNLSVTDPADVEINFSILMPNGTRMIGVIDRIQREPHAVYPCDLKHTGSKLTDWFWKSYDNSLQLSSYYYACQELIGDCNYVGLDAMQVPWSGDDSLQVRTFLRGENQVQEFLNTWCRVTDQIMESSKQMEEFYQNPESCSKYGGCQLLMTCLHGV